MSGGLRVALTLAAALAVLVGCDPGSTGPEPERLLGTRVLESGEFSRVSPGWAWLDGSEIVFLGSGGAGLHAVDVATGSRRTLVPTSEAELAELHLVAPYAYYVRDSTLHRVRTDGSAPAESLVSLAGADDWSISADHSRVYWLASTHVMRARLDTGARDTLWTVGMTLGMRVFASPDGAGALAMDWETFPGRLILRRTDGSGQDGRVPCTVREGSAVRWEDGEPVLYAACGDVFLRHPVTGDSTRVATIGGGQDGTFSPDLARVSAWRRYCPRWIDASTCPEAERELWIADAGETPARVGTIILPTRETDPMSVRLDPLDDTSPAYFSPDGARVAFALNALNEADGLYVVPVD